MKISSGVCVVLPASTSCLLVSQNLFVAALALSLLGFAPGLSVARAGSELPSHAPEMSLASVHTDSDRVAVQPVLFSSPAANAASANGDADSLRRLTAVPGSHWSFGRTSVCSILAKTTAAGVYAVDDIVSGFEEVKVHPRSSQGGSPFLYVGLSLVHAWSQDAPGHVVVRLAGGMLPNGDIVSAALPLAQGEVVGLLLAYVDGNKGFLTLTPQRVWRKSEKGFATTPGLDASEMLTMDDVGALASSGLASLPITGDCGFDIDLGRVAEAVPAASGAPADDGEEMPSPVIEPVESP